MKDSFALIRLNSRMIKNIIFDLGGVILNIDFKKTSEAFTALGVQNFDQYFTQYHSNPLFKQLETGAIINNSFYDNVRSAASIIADNIAIDTAWNAMLLDFPPARIERLKELSVKYRLFLFSNTNAIHHAAFLHQFYELFGFNFDTLFEKAFYSHLIGYRKPDIEAFEYVIKQADVIAEETVFIDDTLPNIESAGKAGLQTIYITKDNDMMQSLAKY
jgi:putative hydrolase of the HAD superfamily